MTATRVLFSMRTGRIRCRLAISSGMVKRTLDTMDSLLTSTYSSPYCLDNTLAISPSDTRLLFTRRTPNRTGIPFCSSSPLFATSSPMIPSATSISPIFLLAPMTQTLHHLLKILRLCPDHGSPVVKVCPFKGAVFISPDLKSPAFRLYRHGAILVCPVYRCPCIFVG